MSASFNSVISLKAQPSNTVIVKGVGLGTFERIVSPRICEHLLSAIVGLDICSQALWDATGDIGD